MTTALAATAVKNRFGRVLRQVTKTGDPIIIERDGKPVAVLMSIDAYQAIQKHNRITTDKASLLDSVFGMWSDRDGIDAAWLANSRTQWASDWHDE